MRNRLPTGATAHAALLGAALAGQAAAALPDPTGPLMPSGKWTVEYADAMCVLSREYAGPDGAITFGVRPLPLGDTTELLFVTPPASARATAVKRGVALAGKAITPDRTIDTAGRRLTTMTVPNAQIETLRGGAEMTVAIDGRPAFRFVAQGLTSALAATETCQRDLLTRWGIDPDERKAMKQPPVPQHPAMLFDADYPADAIREGNEGATTILWTVGIDGRTRDCRVVASSGHRLLDATTCAGAIRRGRYRPAIGHDDKPMEAHLTQRWTWKLPD